VKNAPDPGGGAGWSQALGTAFGLHGKGAARCAFARALSHSGLGHQCDTRVVYRRSK
jgi:hypothetical protein